MLQAAAALVGFRQLSVGLPGYVRKASTGPQPRGQGQTRGQSWTCAEHHARGHFAAPEDFELLVVYS